MLAAVDDLSCPVSADVRASRSSTQKWGQRRCSSIHGLRLLCRYRWITIRRAADRIHIVATLTRRDGRRANLRGTWFALGAACCRPRLGTGYAVRQCHRLPVTPAPLKTNPGIH
ncbi:hypothetical protein Misp03_36940 [Microbispora sp. NBRC 16548]|nr:hypothetical protein Misp03_36940 [Microbispora sp. NBRC 16548]